MKRFLVILETDGKVVLPASSAAVELARSTGSPFDILIGGGPSIRAEALAWADRGAGRVLVAASSSLAHPTAAQIAAVCAPFIDEDTSVAGPSTICEILAYIAGAHDLPMLADVDGVEGSFVRSYAFDGRVMTKVRVDAPRCVFSVRLKRSTQSAVSTVSKVENVSVDEAALPQSTAWISGVSTVHKRPPLHQARVIVAGGRSLGDAASFEQYLGKVADKLGAAVAASGGAVHSGIAPSTQLIGQTGQTVAPELYIAVGISGADQHVGGMQNSRVIVAVNRDPHAAIFRVADYGLVADFQDALPELAEKL